MGGTSTEATPTTVLQTPQTEAFAEAEPTAVNTNEPASAAPDILTAPQPVVIQNAAAPSPEPVATASDAALLLTPMEPQPKAEAAPSPQVDLAKAALDAAQTVSVNTPQSTSSNAISNQDVAWFNQGVQLIEDKKYR